MMVKLSEEPYVETSVSVAVSRIMGCQQLRGQIVLLLEQFDSIWLINWSQEIVLCTFGTFNVRVCAYVYI